MRGLGLVILLASAANAVAYPFAVPKRTGAEAEFRRRNPQHWTKIETDKRGVVIHVATDDPTLVGSKMSAVRTLLHANADLFGFPAAIADGVPDEGLLVDEQAGALMGEIQVQHAANLLDITAMFWVDATPTIDVASVVQRIAGKHYRETIGYGAGPKLDCAMTPLGAKGCAVRIQHTRTREVAIDADAIQATSSLLRQGNSIRLVACAEILTFDDPPADPAWGAIGAAQRTFTPLGKAPALPLVVDRVTGQVLHTNVKTCADPALTDPRQRD